MLSHKHTFCSEFKYSNLSLIHLSYFYFILIQWLYDSTSRNIPFIISYEPRIQKQYDSVMPVLCYWAVERTLCLGQRLDKEWSSLQLARGATPLRHAIPVGKCHYNICLNITIYYAFCVFDLPILFVLLYKIFKSVLLL